VVTLIHSLKSHQITSAKTHFSRNIYMVGAQGYGRRSREQPIRIRRILGQRAFMRPHNFLSYGSELCARKLASR
jgi:hypothetical protein